MFDLESHVQRALKAGDERLADHSAWEAIRAELCDDGIAARRRKRLLVLAGAAMGEALIGPETLLLDITGRCNTTCVFCRDHSPRIENREAWRDMEMPFALLARLIDEAVELGVEKMPILAAGEPTLHSRFPDILESLAASPLCFEIFTNGLLLKKEIRELLARAGKARVYFSVSAANNETFLAQRPGMKGDLLRRVEDNIRSLVEAKGRESGTPRILMVNVIGAGNFRQVIPMMEQAIRLGVDEVQYKLTEISPISRDMILRREQLECLAREMRHVKNMAFAAGIDVQDNLDVQLEWVNPTTGRYAEGLFDRIPCRVGYEFARVRRDGMVSFCCGLKFFHNLNDMTLAEHWWSAEMRRARRVAAAFPQGENMRLPDGGNLRDEQCDFCYNYIVNVHAENEWRRLNGDSPSAKPADTGDEHRVTS